MKDPTDDVYCCLCNDEIDTVLGYYLCSECNQEYCKECAFDRNKMDLGLAENPMLIPTAVSDLQDIDVTLESKMFN